MAYIRRKKWGKEAGQHFCLARSKALQEGPINAVAPQSSEHCLFPTQTEHYKSELLLLGFVPTCTTSAHRLKC